MPEALHRRWLRRRLRLSSSCVNENVIRAPRWRLSAITVCVCGAFAPATSFAEAPSFETSYARVIRANCLRCHNTRDAKGGLDLSTREGLLKGGDIEPAIVVGKPDESLLIQRVTEGSMPPISDGDQLPAPQVELLRSWVAAGAPWSGGAIVIADTPWSHTSAGVRDRLRRTRRLRMWFQRLRHGP